jgi:hypothetical protein
MIVNKPLGHVSERTKNFNDPHRATKFFYRSACVSNADEGTKQHCETHKILSHEINPLDDQRAFWLIWLR